MVVGVLIGVCDWAGTENYNYYYFYCSSFYNFLSSSSTSTSTMMMTMQKVQKFFSFIKLRNLGIQDNALVCSD